MERDRIDRNHGTVSPGTLVISFNPGIYKSLLARAHESGVTPMAVVEELVERGLSDRRRVIKAPEASR